ncbi:type II toxin-antitoxin system RelE/ParE family toxin [Brevundimonas sp.]|uniref:type II toxin-antitoxin system RelE/ParE family toxin n=1 Tax=Brevundimonas sp. TaxID=1871086 RepID=UPI00260B6807|nr:type II toxin-antitoxin system RelE/ParE family toxin [Brevundimonas sp.]
MNGQRFRVVQSSAAARDLVRAYEWLTQPGAGVAARRTLLAIEAAIKGLRTDHHRWPGSDHDGARERRVDGYTIIYRIDVAVRTVSVLRVFGPFQDRSTL